LHAERVDGLEHHVVRAGAALGLEAVEGHLAAGVRDDGRPGVAAGELDPAVAGEVDVVGVVDVPAVRRPGTDAVGVVVGRIVARHAGTDVGVPARHGDVYVVERDVGRLVRRVRAPDRRAVLRAALAGDGDAVVGDVADVPHAGTVPAPLAGTDLLHDRR